ncbi:MAG: RnfH family protein [Porticoccaceae bacterium]|nr:RnfH family protein [Porticoccaceae bacterium]
MTSTDDLIAVEVAYALPEKQQIIKLKVARGTSAYDAVAQSGIVGQFPNINLAEVAMGIFSQPLGSKGMPAAKDYILEPGDRVELYRPLLADPKEVRKQRAEKTRKTRDS